MRLFSYVVARDYGFAPNPFNGLCTLATCKPLIRRTANVSDWIVGLTSTADSKEPRIIYVMQIAEAKSFDEYWSDPRFSIRKPSRFSSLKRAFGDNIYHRGGDGNWLQADSHHSLDSGEPNYKNIAVDTQTNRVLIGTRYAYWGSSGPKVPEQFLDSNGETLQIARGHRSQFSEKFINEFVVWFDKQQVQGFLGRPYRWQRKRAAWANLN